MNRHSTPFRKLTLSWVAALSLTFASWAAPETSIVEEMPIACNDLVHISLDSNCLGTVTPIMLLENMQGAASDYTITIKDTFGNDYNGLIFGYSQVGHTFTYSIVYNETGNSCWGKIKIEDKYPPTLQCLNDTIRCGNSLSPYVLGFPIPSWINTPFPAWLFANLFAHPTLPNTFIVYNWDKCGIVILKYFDAVTTDNCNEIFFKKITRSWMATDINGNVSMCEQIICIYTPTDADIVMPPSYDGLDLDAIPCSLLIPTLPNGNPSPEYTGYPVPKECSTLNAAYTDIRIQICSGSFKVIRKWTILNWCTKNITEFYQIIKVLDDQKPSIECPEDLTIGMDPYVCSGTYKLTGPISVLDCSDYTWRPFTRNSDDPTHKNDYDSQYIYYDDIEKCYYLKDAPEGRIWVIYIVTDDCGNSEECVFEIGVTDDLAPIAVCDQKTVITLGIDGTARLFAHDLDDGSVDNCRILEYRARRMDDTCKNGTIRFGPYVEFCCLDVGSTKMVAMEVIDESGNRNTCMVEVVVQEKEPPFIEAPDDITISCGFDWVDLEQFGTVVFDPNQRKNIIIRDPYYSATGFIAGRDGFAYDNCFVDTTVTVRYYLICGLGTIVRIFTATDRQGLTTTDSQTITIINPYPFNREDIIWPADITIYSCNNVETHPDFTGIPVPDPNKVACALIASQYDDLRLVVLDSACYKILRRWTVIDWCQYSLGNNLGLWEYTQIIYILNSDPPDLDTLTCKPVDFCDTDSFYDPVSKICYGNYHLVGIATDDCTKEQDLVWQFRLDRGNDGTFDSLYNGKIASGVLPLGEHRIRWIVSDQCGNHSVCDQIFTIRDCKKPTPYCLNGIVTVLMGTNQQITVWASDLNLNSFDNCTHKDSLKYSFSSDVNDKFITFTCDSLAGKLSIERLVRIYVTDEFGNQDYCETFIRIQDNGVCAPTTNLEIEGKITRDDQTIVAGVNIEIEDQIGNILQRTITDTKGNYAFSAMPVATYTIHASKNDDIINGVTTLDIILIQKHILNQKPITSPYLLLAADVNKSSSITARDMSDIRKVILGTSTQFEKTPNWRFVPKYYVFENPNLPWNAPYQMQTNLLHGNYDKADWVGIKAGDVNLSAFCDQARSGEIRGKSIAQFELKNVSYQKGKNLIAVYADLSSDIEGFQFAMSFSEADIHGINILPAQCQLTSGHFTFQDQLMKVSYHTSSSQKWISTEPLFYIELESAQAIPVQSLELSTAFTNELYTSGGEPMELRLRSLKNKTEVKSLNAFAPVPNPFNQSCTIQFEIPEASSVVLRMLNPTGKEINRIRIEAKSGLNQIEINRQQLIHAGLYYLILESAVGNASFKVMMID